MVYPLIVFLTFLPLTSKLLWIFNTTLSPPSIKSVETRTVPINPTEVCFNWCILLFIYLFILQSRLKQNDNKVQLLKNSLTKQQILQKENELLHQENQVLTRSLGALEDKTKSISESLKEVELQNQEIQKFLTQIETEWKNRKIQQSNLSSSSGKFSRAPQNGSWEIKLHEEELRIIMGIPERFNKQFFFKTDF